MKYLTDRHEIAMALNFGKYPVLKIDMETPYKDYEGYYVGDRCKCAYECRHEGRETRGNVTYSEDSGKFRISSNCTCISSSFGYSDVIEDYAWATAQSVRAGQIVVLIEDYPISRTCRVRMMKVSDRIDPHCMTAATLEDLD